MPEEIPKALNDLEQYLINLQEGKLKTDDFVQQLLDIQIFMPVEDDKSEITGLQTSTKAKPLTVKNENDDLTLIIFSSPDRSRSFIKHFPKYSGGLLVEFSWILERIGTGIAVSINPEWDYGIDFEPDMVEQLIHMNASRADQQPTTG